MNFCGFGEMSAAAAKTKSAAKRPYAMTPSTTGSVPKTGAGG